MLKAVTRFVVVAAAAAAYALACRFAVQSGTGLGAALIVAVLVATGVLVALRDERRDAGGRAPLPAAFWFYTAASGAAIVASLIVSFTPGTDASTVQNVTMLALALSVAAAWYARPRFDRDAAPARSARSTRSTRA